MVKRLSSAGKPCLNVEVRVVNEEGKDSGTGEVGEVIVRGYHMMKGYWNLPEATSETIRNGWVHTGDLGYFDSEGYLFLVDRIRDVIISGAFNIYPKEIENVIVTHPKVKEAVVIGVPDEKWGEAVKAVVVLKGRGSGRRAGDHRLLPRPYGQLQEAEVGRFHQGTAPESLRQDPEDGIERSLLGRV